MLSVEPGKPFVDELLEDVEQLHERLDIQEAKWYARRYTAPIADVEREFGFKPGELRKRLEGDER